MRTGVAALAGGSLGVGLMYVLDPDRGKRWRAALRDQALHAAALGRHALGTSARDLDHRARRVVARLSAGSTEEPPSDAVLVARVRATLGRVVAYPHGVVLTATAVRVALSGPVLATEVQPVLLAVGRVRGVRDIENRLEGHARVDELPGLRARRQQRALQPEPLEGHWSPAVRTLALVVGGIVVGVGVRHRDAPGAALGVLGAGLLLRGLTNVSFKRLLGVGMGRRAVDLEKTITLPAPVDQLYGLWTTPKTLPRYLAHVRHVRQISDVQSHWTVAGPFDRPIEWDAVVTQRIPDALLAWQTLPGALVSHAGSVRFERLDVRLRYTPRGGVREPDALEDRSRAPTERSRSAVVRRGPYTAKEACYGRVLSCTEGCLRSRRADRRTRRRRANRQYAPCYDGSRSTTGAHHRHV